MLTYTMRLGICDNDPADLDRLTRMVQEIAAQAGITCEMTLYQSAAALLQAIESGTEYHALLLDVMMDEMTGMELAARLRRQKNQTAIVFISSNRDMALCGYEVSALRFLAKPVAADKLHEALLLCYESGMNAQRLLLPTANGMRHLSVADILYVETFGRGLRIALTDGSEQISMKISDLEAMLPENQFTMCHRTILVNLAHVKYLRYCELELKTGGVLPVSKYRQNAVREKLFHYLEG